MCYSNRYCFYNWPPGLSLPPHPIPAYESYLCFSPVTLLARWLPSPPPSLKLIISPCGGQGATVNTCKFYVTHCNGKVSRWISADNKWVCGMNTHLLPFGFSPFSSILIPETRVCQKSPLPWGKANGDSILRSHLFRRVENVLLWMQMTVGAGVGGLVFVIVLLCSVNAATLKIVLSWKSASHHHPDFDCTLSPTL